MKPGLGELEVGEIAGELDPRQRPQQRQGGRQQGGAEDHHAAAAGGQNDVDLDLVARDAGGGGAGLLQGELELEGGAKIVTGEMAQIEALRGRPAGGDERVAGIGPPGGAGTEPLHGGPDIEPLEKGGDGVRARTVLILAHGAPAAGERASGVGDADVADRLRELGFEAVAGPDDPDDPPLLVEVVAAFSGPAGKIAEDLTALDVEEPGRRRWRTGMMRVASHSHSSYQGRSRDIDSVNYEF